MQYLARLREIGLLEGAMHGQGAGGGSDAGASVE